MFARRVASQSIKRASPLPGAPRRCVRSFRAIRARCRGVGLRRNDALRWDEKGRSGNSCPHAWLTPCRDRCNTLRVASATCGSGALAGSSAPGPSAFRARSGIVGRIRSGGAGRGPRGPNRSSGPAAAGSRSGETDGGSTDRPPPNQRSRDDRSSCGAGAAQPVGQRCARRSGRDHVSADEPKG